MKEEEEFSILDSIILPIFHFWDFSAHWGEIEGEIDERGIRLLKISLCSNGDDEL